MAFPPFPLSLVFCLEWMPVQASGQNCSWKSRAEFCSYQKCSQNSFLVIFKRIFFSLIMQPHFASQRRNTGMVLLLKSVELGSVDRHGGSFRNILMATTIVTPTVHILKSYRDKTEMVMKKLCLHQGSISPELLLFLLREDVSGTLQERTVNIP